MVISGWANWPSRQHCVKLRRYTQNKVAWATFAVQASDSYWSRKPGFLQITLNRALNSKNYEESVVSVNL
ncbi:MAG: hypothetical protein D6816_14380 [Bacteroidetes bacterium]|nr:MAG: hypothetical protein D6816_14380 [Bacteroidota bacterium]